MAYKFNPFTGNFDLVSDLGELGYVHEQGSPSTAWVIVHNLGFRPNWLFVDSAGTINEPASITHDSENQTTATFKAAFGGTAFGS